MRRDDPAITWSTRLFRMLLILYPASFRRDYGREMTLVFRDTCRQIQHRQGAAGILELWLTTLMDLFSTALIERLAEVYQMSSTAMFTRISGLVAALGGVALLILAYRWFVLGRVGGETLGFLMPVFGLCAAIGAAGLYVLGQHDSTSRLGLGLAFLGGLTISVGMILLFLIESEIFLITWGIGMLVHEIGLVVFGWSAFKHNSLPRWNALPFIVGGLALLIFLIGILIGIVFSNEALEIFFGMWLVAVGLGWIGLGALIMLGGRQVTYIPGAAA